MNKRIVKGVSGNQFTFQAVVAVTQSVSRLLADAVLVKAELVATEGRAVEIRHSRVSAEVKALQVGRFDRGWSAQPVEAIHDEDCPPAALCLIGG